MKVHQIIRLKKESETNRGCTIAKITLSDSKQLAYQFMFAYIRSKQSFRSQTALNSNSFSWMSPICHTGSKMKSPHTFLVGKLLKIAGQSFRRNPQFLGWDSKKTQV